MLRVAGDAGEHLRGQAGAKSPAAIVDCELLQLQPRVVRVVDLKNEVGRRHRNDEPERAIDVANLFACSGKDIGRTTDASPSDGIVVLEARGQYVRTALT